jgi:glycosyltransferase involved in cell wall biosynthesis
VDNLENDEYMTTKILMIAPQPFFEPRGTPISVYQRLVALSALGHQVDLLTYHLGQDVNIAGIRIYRVPVVPGIKAVKVGPSWAKIPLDILLFCKAIVMLATNRYDVIHSHEEAAFFAALLARMFGVRHLYDMHSSLPQQLRNSRSWNHWPLVRLFEILERWVIDTCDAIITIGADLERLVMAMNPKTNQVRIENLAMHSYNSTTNHRSADQLREQLGLHNRLPIVYTGTFEHYQGLNLLLGSAKIVKKHHPEVSFVLAGGKPEQLDCWQNEARKHDLEDCMLFLGVVPPAEALNFLELAEILISPRSDGTSVPLKIYSYLHSGKPIIATNLIAHTQVLDDEIALLVAPSEEALADGILKLVESPALRQRLGDRAQQFAREKFNPADYLARVTHIYQTLKPATGSSEPAAPLHPSSPASSQNHQTTPPSWNPET